VNETNISFYLHRNRIHIFIESLKAIGSPKYICFMLDETGSKLIMKPYHRKDFHSHRVPPGVYTGKQELEICSVKLCKILSEIHDWNGNSSYRVPGVILPKQDLVLFDLSKSAKISPSGNRTQKM